MEGGGGWLSAKSLSGGEWDISCNTISTSPWRLQGMY
jgi:hypothetical protein